MSRDRGPVFLVCGERDQLWPSCPYADAIARRLVDHPHTLLHEPGAGHLVRGAVPNLPTPAVIGSGGDRQADALGGLDAWPELLGFLATRANN